MNYRQQKNIAKLSDVRSIIRIERSKIEDHIMEEQITDNVKLTIFFPQSSWNIIRGSYSWATQNIKYDSNTCAQSKTIAKLSTQIVEPII